MVQTAVSSRVIVDRLWPESTIVCLATGPSLCQEDVDACRGRARVVAVKDAIRLAPWADALYACDAKWWRHHAAALTGFTGPRYSLEAKAAPYATVLRNTGESGLESDPSGLRTGRNSGFQGIGLSYHLGARTILLLGYDMRPDGQRDHWFGAHPYPAMRPPYEQFLRLFGSIVAPLKAAGVTVINCTRESALECFPKMSLDKALESISVAA